MKANHRKYEHNSSTYVPEINQTTFVLDAAFGVRTRVRAHARAGALPRARVRAAGGMSLRAVGRGKNEMSWGFLVDHRSTDNGKQPSNGRSKCTRNCCRQLIDQWLRPSVDQGSGKIYQHFGRLLVDRWLRQSSEQLSSKMYGHFWSTIGRPMAAPIGRAKQGSRKKR